MRLYHGSLQIVREARIMEAASYRPLDFGTAVEEIAKARGTDPLEELPKFYASATYRASENEKSKYWWFSPAELCSLYLRDGQSAGGGT